MDRHYAEVLLIIGAFYVGNCVRPENSDKLQNCRNKNQTECTRCETGSCGKFCDKSCSGNCLSDCDITTCECRNCADGFHGRICSLNCSAYCGTYSSKKASCKRNTGACKNGCQPGRCLTEKGCREKCSINCINGTCLGVDCECMHGCVDGYWGPTCRKGCMDCTTWYHNKAPPRVSSRVAASLTLLLCLLPTIVLSWLYWKYTTPLDAYRTWRLGHNIFTVRNESTNEESTMVSNEESTNEESTNEATTNKCFWVLVPTVLLPILFSITLVLLFVYLFE